jgi:AcrR family transcriptional regulator
MSESTRGALLAAARQAFATQGFKGATIRAITTHSRANLGAITYHFGSKRELYHAVLDQATAPIRKALGSPIAEGATALDKIEFAVRRVFAFLHANPDVPRLIIQVLVRDEPLPPPVQATIRLIMHRFTDLIEQGQREGTVRQGPPVFLALAFAGQPMSLGIYRRALSEAIGLDQSDTVTSRRLVEVVVAFFRAGLAQEQPA